MLLYVTMILYIILLYAFDNAPYVNLWTANRGQRNIINAFDNAIYN